MTPVLRFPEPPPPAVRGAHDSCPDCHGRAWAPAGPGHLVCRNCSLLVVLDPKRARP